MPVVGGADMSEGGYRCDSEGNVLNLAMGMLQIGSGGVVPVDAPSLLWPISIIL